MGSKDEATNSETAERMIEAKISVSEEANLPSTPKNDKVIPPNTYYGTRDFGFG